MMYEFGHANPCKSHTISSSAILPITNTMANPGIPLTGSTAMGFTIGIIKGWNYNTQKFIFYIK